MCVGNRQAKSKKKTLRSSFLCKMELLKCSPEFSVCCAVFYFPVKLNWGIEKKKPINREIKFTFYFFFFWEKRTKQKKMKQNLIDIEPIDSNSKTDCLEPRSIYTINVITYHTVIPFDLSFLGGESIEWTTAFHWRKKKNKNRCNSFFPVSR